MFKLTKHILITLLVISIGVSIGYGVSAGWLSDSNDTESRRVEQQQEIYINSQPIPTFDWSLERHIFIELYKARNNAVTTYSYVRNMHGEVIFSCESIGFPLPANMQLTNPEKYDYNGATIPQVEPNGLYTSPSSVGTYIFCTNEDGTVSPSYFEQKVESHLSPLKDDEKSLTKNGSLKIDVNK